MTQAGGIYSPGSSLFYSGVGVVLFTAPRGAPHPPVGITFAEGGVLVFCEAKIPGKDVVGRKRTAMVYAGFEGIKG